MTYSEETETILADVLTVYGKITASQLRNQSHLEAPWQEASRRVGDEIDDELIVQHFRELYAHPERKVAPPAYPIWYGQFRA